MSKVKILWATKIGNPDWQEELITEFEVKIPFAKIWAKNNGYDRLRVSEIDLRDKPDFGKTINV